MARITDERILMERVLKMLPKGVPASAIEAVECDPYDGGDYGDKPSYWVYLNDGWISPEMECHTIHEDTLRDLADVVGNIQRWDDDPDLERHQGYTSYPAQEIPVDESTQDSRPADKPPVKRLEVFHNDVIGLLESYAPDVLDHLDQDEYDDIDHLFDFEDFDLFVVNAETVITTDGLTGDVIGTLPLCEFITEALSNIPT